MITASVMKELIEEVSEDAQSKKNLRYQIC